VIEVITPLVPAAVITSHHLARAGRQPDQRTDISHLISFTVTG
jgi:hypothetical protein